MNNGSTPPTNAVERALELPVQSLRLLAFALSLWAVEHRLWHLRSAALGRWQGIGRSGDILRQPGSLIRTMKPFRPVTVSVVGLCAFNVALQTKDKDPLAKMPPAGPLSHIITTSTSSVAMDFTVNMVTSARYELPRIWKQVIYKIPRD